jgi:DCN1-like protein 1/2
VFRDLLTVLYRYFSGGGGSTGSSATKATLSKIFDQYREDPKAEPDAVGVDGTMKYFDDTDVDLNGLDSFAAHEIVQAPAMGELTREGFVNGWQERK